MRRPLTVAACTALLASATASTAMAAAVPAFTATPTGDLTVLFDGSASVCEFGPCGYDWRHYDGTNRLGATVGYGEIVSYRFAEAGWHTVVLKVSQHCWEGSLRSCWRALSQAVFVPEPEPVTPPDPPVADPAAAPEAAV